MDLLAEMAASSAARVARATEPLEALKERALAVAAAPPLRLGTFDLIAEVKLRAPSAGKLAADDPARRARIYAEAGAAAVSVLTEPTRFDGDLAHLAAASGCGVPVMRKDFLVDPYQVWEARAAGAGGVLLIARMLDDRALGALLDAASEAGLWALVEAFDEADLARTGGAALVGVNCRDLVTLRIDFDRLLALADRIPAGAVPVAESGVSTPEQARAVASAGYRMALVGTALMTASEPGALARSLLEAGREDAWPSS